MSGGFCDFIWEVIVMIMGIFSFEGSRDYCSGLGFKIRRVSRDFFKVSYCRRVFGWEFVVILVSIFGMGFLEKGD